MNDAPRRDGKFNFAAWQEELLALNPWARGLTISKTNEVIGIANETFVAARQTATLDRHTHGGEVWNAWAKRMLALRAALESAGQWSAERPAVVTWPNYSAGRIVGRNQCTQQWLNLAFAVFSSPEKKHEFDFAQFGERVFPGDAVFHGATFSRTTGFNKATFHGDAVFDHATFLLTTSFDGATFFNEADFLKVAFRNGVIFAGATFRGDAKFIGTSFNFAWFPRATFSRRALFNDATFSNFVEFNSTTFYNAADFCRTTFASTADFKKVRFISSVAFSQAKFTGAATLGDAEFCGDAKFEAIDSGGTFSLANASFRQVPDFTGASFRGLRLDNVQTPRYRLLGWTSDSDAPARFRELKRRAAEAKDHDRELDFFAQEIRTARFHARGLPAFVPRVWEWRFWFGLLFGAFSNFGRSLWRPLLFWSILLLGFASLYLGEHEDMRRARAALNPTGTWSTLLAYAETTSAALANPPACKHGDRELFAATNAVTESFQLSLRNALVFEGVRPDATRRTLGCLYGLEHVGDQEYPKVWPSVSLASTLQSLASGLLIFLFLLAVRNLLRLK
jgi:uncharacterized protein YjbI with pentapeptide repeats